ncbi:hypothetical protein LJR038_000675 [Acidovorax sp. LjRoot38]|uniref:hypothetical protein n=1 Tax=Acidovorax sp. LjRoot38 TaxID=3342327 RepID=UPI003ECCAFB0
MADQDKPVRNWNGFDACKARLTDALAALVGSPDPGAFGKVSVHITPARDGNALPVERWVHDAQVLINCLRAIEPTAQVRIDVTGIGAMHSMAMHDAGVDVGQFVRAVDYAPVLALIPEALRPCTRTDLPAKHAVLGCGPAPSQG